MMKSEFVKNVSKEIVNCSFSPLSGNAVGQMAEYLYLYKNNNCTQHWMVNNIISRTESWDEYSEIRSLNDHGYEKKIKGIMPKYYAIACEVLRITGDNGEPLISAHHY